MGLVPGDEVRLHSLVGAPEHNGRIGVVRRWNADRGRYIVAIAAQAGARSLAVRADNLASVQLIPAKCRKYSSACWINELPTSILTQILTGCPCENLVEHVALCAQVHPEWRRIIRGSATYRLQLQIPPTGDPKVSSPSLMLGRLRDALNDIVDAGCLRRALQLDGKKLPKADSEGRICHVLQMFRGWPIKDTGMAVLSEALQAQAAARLHVHDINLQNNELSGRASSAIVAVIRKCVELKTLLLGGDVLSRNRLGDRACAMLAQALPWSLEQLRLGRTDCGDKTAVAIASTLPQLQQLTSLDLDRNPALGSTGAAALGRALAQAASLQSLSLNGCSVGCEGAVALAQGLTRASWLRRLDLMDCKIGVRGASALSEAILDSCMAVGDRVEVIGLTTQRSMNGMAGVVAGRRTDREGRYVVRPLSPSTAQQTLGGHARHPILVKAGNLNSRSRLRGLRYLGIRGNAFNTRRQGANALEEAGEVEPMQTTGVAACARMVEVCTQRRVTLQ